MEVEKQQLGGTRKSSPLEDEMSYPLTSDEFLLLKENLKSDKINNLEALLLSVAVSSFISLVIFYNTCSLSNTEIINNETITEINNSSITILILYISSTIGCLIGFFVSRINKGKSKKIVERLCLKISSHLNK